MNGKYDLDKLKDAKKLVSDVEIQESVGLVEKAIPKKIKPKNKVGRRSHIPSSETANKIVTKISLPTLELLKKMFASGLDENYINRSDFIETAILEKMEKEEGFKREKKTHWWFKSKKVKIN